MKVRVISTGKGIFPGNEIGTMCDCDTAWKTLYIGIVVWDRQEMNEAIDGILVRSEEIRELSPFEELILNTLEENDVTRQGTID